MFKRRRPDDPAASDTLPAGLAADEPDEADVRIGFVPAMPGDTGLGVPPFRPAAAKEAPAMSRPYLTSAHPLEGAASSSTNVPNPAAPARPVAGTQSAAPSPEKPERRTLVVGRGISLQGTVQDAERLVVEGTVEASMIHATELAIAKGGTFKGEVEVEEAEITGTFNGTLTARGNLIVRGTGRVLGQARCRRLQVEDGGQISGQMEMLSDIGAREVAPKPELRPVPEPVD